MGLVSQMAPWWQGFDVHASSRWHSRPANKQTKNYKYETNKKLWLQSSEIAHLKGVRARYCISLRQKYLCGECIGTSQTWSRSSEAKEGDPPSDDESRSSALHHAERGKRTCAFFTYTREPSYLDVGLKPPLFQVSNEPDRQSEHRQILDNDW